MTKEKIFEELLAKRSAASQSSSNDDGSLDWQKTGGLDEEQLKIGKSPHTETEGPFTSGGQFE